MGELIKVGMADLNAVASPGILTTLGLGSCVGIALYDKVNKIAGLAHIMLPSSNTVKNNANPAKFADTAIDVLLEQMYKIGADKTYITAKIAGGAQMFSFKNQDNDILRVGERNVQATINSLKEHDIAMLARDTGGNYGRTIELYADSGILLVKTIANGIKKL